jgi:hypothetical protein
MYVITDHNSGDFVILGPIAWKPRYISSILSDELDVEISVTAEDEARVPFVVHPGVVVRRCETVYEEINNKIHTHDGPYWTYDTKHPTVQATATWRRKDKPIETVKHELKAQVADIRWSKENTGVFVNIQGVEVWCDTARGARDIFLQKYSIMLEGESLNWKFPNNTWISLSKSDLGLIVSSGAAHIQACFDWEAQQAQIIDACSTLEELDALIFEPAESVDG